MSNSTKRLQTRKQRADRRIVRDMPFVGVDGEGGDRNGKHVYHLLRAGEYAIESDGDGGLNPYDCFGFLADLRKDRLYVAFAFDYDVTMMIKHLHPSKVERLFDRESRAIRDADGQETGRYYPVMVGKGQYEIDYLPRKEFRVRRVGGKWTYISDVFTFFQCSFVRALERFFPEDVFRERIEKIAEGKAMRNEFFGVTEYEREYNKLEILMLEHLMERFRALCHDLDIRPRKWQGPGNLVTSVFRREGLPSRHAQRIPERVWEDANQAYYGGRFEVSTYGLIDEKVYQYDINSAYASYYRHLPCLQHGHWERICDLPTDPASIYVADVHFRHRTQMAWYTLPVRSDKGTLLFPREGRGSYWCHELVVASRYADIDVKGGWRLISTCECRHFDWVYQLYDERDRVGKDSGKGKVLKVVLATIYGKLAQSLGTPVFANPIWSGLVVSYCRATLIEAALSLGNGGADVLMLATDGMFTTTPRDVTVGRGLGEWSLDVHDQMFIVQSGVYFMPGIKPKTRGVPQSKVIEHENTFRTVWDDWCWQGDVDNREPYVDVALRVFIAARLARTRGTPWMAGRWLNASKRVRFDWTTKRDMPRLSNRRLDTLPVEGGPDLVSNPPVRMVGGQVPEERLWESDAPDWQDHLTGVMDNE